MHNGKTDAAIIVALYHQHGGVLNGGCECCIAGK